MAYIKICFISKLFRENEAPGVGWGGGGGVMDSCTPRTTYKWRRPGIHYICLQKRVLRFLRRNFKKLCLHKGTEFLPKILILKSYIFSTWWCKPLIIQTIIICWKMIDSLKYLRSPTLKDKKRDKKIRICAKNYFIRESAGHFKINILGDQSVSWPTYNSTLRLNKCTSPYSLLCSPALMSCFVFNTHCFKPSHRRGGGQTKILVCTLYIVQAVH